MRAASGHCYFTLKDANGQLRCAMFRRAAGLLNWQPRDGDRVEVRGRLAVYAARGDLQLVAESMSRAGQGALFEEFLRIKAELQAQGLFDEQRKRPLTPYPRGLGLITSLGAAALHDVATALRRRAPHVPVLLLRGVESDLVLKEVAEKMMTRGPGAKGLLTWLEIEGCGHAPALNVELHFAAVLRCLKKV